MTGIRRKLFTLPDNTLVYPGHGPTTTTGEEKRTNPYCGEPEIAEIAAKLRLSRSD